MLHRPVSTFLFIAIAFSVLSWNSTPLRAELIHLGETETQTQDNPNGKSGPANVAAIVSVINNNLVHFSTSDPFISTDLILMDKDDGFGGDSGFDMTGIGSHDGTYSYTGPGFIQIMTLKSGNNPVEVYAVPTDLQSGAWENGYKNALSHASVWRIKGAAVVPGPVAIPEPTSFAMFGIAMLAMSRRRRQR